MTVVKRLDNLSLAHLSQSLLLSQREISSPATAYEKQPMKRMSSR